MPWLTASPCRSSEPHNAPASSPISWSASRSQAARQAINAEATEQVFLLLLNIDHEDLAEPIRVVNNTEDITSRGDLYAAYPFEIALPGEDPESVARVSLRIDNVDRQIVQSLRAVQAPLAVALEVVLAASADTVEAGPFNMTLVSAEYDAFVVTGELAFEDVLNEPFPGHSYIPSEYPGLF